MIQIMLMKTTHMNMVDILTISGKDLVLEVVDLEAGRQWALGEGM